MTIIHTLKLGYVNSFLLKGSRGFILIDTGPPNRSGALLKSLSKRGVSLEEIKLIIITHAHQDHTGGLQVVQQRTGASVLIHETEAEYLRTGHSPHVTAHSKLLEKLVSMSKEVTYAPVNPDIVIHEKFSLSDYGVDGTVIHTPGHTSGSLSVIVEGKYAFIGDTAMQFPLLSRGSLRPLIAQDLAAVRHSWKKILDSGVQTIFLSHGKPWSADKFQKQFDAFRI